MGVDAAGHISSGYDAKHYKSTLPGLSAMEYIV